ncbi:hypothetical protein QUC32_25690 [Novosphingobium resinovorum]|jgi:hypothetical protein|uniref:Uncharacterized protein n=1 Tax=Novosphingobium resinovorum TaxID=158500 RepID=A0A031K0P7_9SPHN|nr:MULTISPECIES: hypothetical protein [Novosphingobium]EZP82187.1 hypothetical protein BV97_02210 [Novosphingobium resinovorum]MBF7013020.1 hypothetical protein [Novosphingobium sp. HR1a]WJM27755.1 hypothetical protein QUC32_25690 [Novosphingobium resinovorum]
MFGTKITHVFRSRWHALMWSAGVLATAYCSIPTPDNGDTNTDQAQQAKADAEQAAQAHQIVAAWSNATGGK